LALRPSDLGPGWRQFETFGDPNANLTISLVKPTPGSLFPQDISATVQVFPDSQRADQAFHTFQSVPPSQVHSHVPPSQPALGEATFAYTDVDTGYSHVFTRVKNVIVSAETYGSVDRTVPYVQSMADRTRASLSVANGWDPGPDARGASTVLGAVEPAEKGTLTDSTLDLNGWVVDTLASADSGIDMVRIYDGAMDSGTLLGNATIGGARPDVASALGVGAWVASGFTARLDMGQLAPGPHRLAVYAHSPSKGWWKRSLLIFLSAAPIPTPNPVPTPTQTPTPILDQPVPVEQTPDQPDQEASQ
jgi:hypothetical protein